MNRVCQWIVGRKEGWERLIGVGTTPSHSAPCRLQCRTLTMSGVLVTVNRGRVEAGRYCKKLKRSTVNKESCICSRVGLGTSFCTCFTPYIHSPHILPDYTCTALLHASIVFFPQPTHSHRLHMHNSPAYCTPVVFCFFTAHTFPPDFTCTTLLHTAHQSRFFVFSQPTHSPQISHAQLSCTPVLFFVFFPLFCVTAHAKGHVQKRAVPVAALSISKGAVPSR